MIHGVTWQSKAEEKTKQKEEVHRRKKLQRSLSEGIRMRRATAMKTCPLLDFKRRQLAMRKKAQHTLEEKRKENTE